MPPLTQQRLQSVTSRQNPLVKQLWAALPAGNDPGCTGSPVSGSLLGSRCDGLNMLGFKSNMSIPQNDNMGVARLDHDFGANWHFFGSYRYYRLDRASTSQFDIAGLLPGTKAGVPTSVSSRPQLPWYWVAGLTTTISPTVTNDFHYSLLRNSPTFASLKLQKLAEGAASSPRVVTRFVCSIA